MISKYQKPAENEVVAFISRSICVEKPFPALVSHASVWQMNVTVSRPTSVWRKSSYKRCVATTSSWCRKSWIPSTTCRERTPLPLSWPQSSKSLTLRSFPVSLGEFITTLVAVSGPQGSEADFLADLSDLLWDVESPGGQTALLPHCQRCSAGQDVLCCANSCLELCRGGFGWRKTHCVSKLSPCADAVWIPWLIGNWTRARVASLEIVHAAFDEELWVPQDWLGFLQHWRFSFPKLNIFFAPPPSQALIEAHDQVAAKCYETPMSAVNSDTAAPTSLMPADAIRMIGIQKRAGEPLVCWWSPGLPCDSPVRLSSV